MRTLPAAFAAAIEPAGHQIVERHDLGLDEALLEVRVDYPAAFGAVSPGESSTRAPLSGPRSDTSAASTCGNRPRQRIQAALGLTDRFQQLGCGLLVELLQFRLDLGVRNTASAGATISRSSATRAASVSTDSSALNTYRNGLEVIRFSSRSSVTSTPAANRVVPPLSTSCAASAASCTGSPILVRAGFFSAAAAHAPGSACQPGSTRSR